MAILSNGKFYGFLCSAKETGQKLANGVKEYVEDFVSGFAGHGWKIWEYVKGKWMLEIDSIRVRGQFTVFEMLISKVRAIIGAQAITQGCGKVKTAELSEDGTAYLITLEDADMSFMEHDFIRCQEFTGSQKVYHVEIESVADGIIRVPLSEFDLDEEGIVLNPPVPGDDIVQFGNSSHDEKYVGRHSAIYMHADEGLQPAIDVLDGIYSKDWSDCLKVRMGGDIPNSGGLKGFYCMNGMIKAVDDNGDIIYEFAPDGSVNLGKGNIIYNPQINKVSLGSGVVLTWNNLSDETKENLKGESGKDGVDGENGINGADGVNGKDGVSVMYKGEFSSHPIDPKNGWYYRNTANKKCYVYQDNAWYVMTVDGSNGKDGLDGVNGKDGNDGLDIVWKGDSSTPPVNPQKNWVYRDTDNGRIYIYTGTAWALMVADGNDGMDGADGEPGVDGKDGMRIYISYNDSEEEPEKPAGDGTTNGWHTNSSKDVIWISQKVAESAGLGVWGDPIKIKGEDGKPGQDANLLSWIKKWDGYATELGEEYIVTPKMFSGIKSADGKLTGITQGKDCLTDKDGNKRTGIFALVDNKIVFELDPINKQYEFRGKIVADSIIMKEFALLSSAVFNGEYLFSQQGVDEKGLVTTAYEYFNPNNPGEAVNGKVFIPNTLTNFKTGAGWMAGNKLSFDEKGNINMCGYIQEETQNYDSGIDSMSTINIKHSKLVLVGGDCDVSSTIQISTLTTMNGVLSPFKIKLNTSINVKFYNLSSFMWILKLEEGRCGSFRVTDWEDYSDIDRSYSMPKVMLHGGRLLDLIFYPTTTITVNVGNKSYNYYNGYWNVMNPTEFELHKEIRGDNSDYYLESKKLSYK